MGKKLEKDHLMVDKVVVVRDIHWESHLVQNLELMEALLLTC